MKISFVIPNFNGELLLKDNIPTILTIARKNNAEVIIVDDCSEDNSIALIKKLQEVYKKDLKIILVKNEKNLGFASAANIGVAKAEGDIVVLLNTDVVPQEDFLLPLISHFKNENVFAVGCMDKSIERGKTILRGRGVGKWKRGFLMHARGEVDRDNTLWVSGGSGAFRKSLWEKFGGFNELYNPFYWEDIDLSYRALKSGYTVLFDAKSIVTHEHEKGAIKSKYTQKEIKTIAYRNQFIFVWSNITDITLLLSHFFWLPYHMISLFLKKEWEFFKGFGEAIGLLQKILSYRKEKKKYYQKSDYEVIRAFASSN